MERSDAALVIVLAIMFLTLALRGDGPEAIARHPSAPDSIALGALFADLANMRAGDNFTFVKGEDAVSLWCTGEGKQGDIEVRIIETLDRRFVIDDGGRIHAVYELLQDDTAVPLLERRPEEGALEATDLEEVEVALEILSTMSPPHIMGLRNGTCLNGAVLVPGTYATDYPEPGSTMIVEKGEGGHLARFGSLHVFDWESVPGAGEAGLRRYLNDSLGVSWALGAEISRGPASDQINLTAPGHWASFILDPSTGGVTLQTDEGGVRGLTSRRENGRVRVYDHDLSLLLDPELPVARMAFDHTTGEIWVWDWHLEDPGRLLNCTWLT